MRIMLKSKIYNAKVTDVDSKCDGSIAIDYRILAEANIIPYEQVTVLNSTNGKRFITYAIKGEIREFKIMGAATRLVNIGDELIILAYQIGDEYKVNLVNVEEN